MKASKERILTTHAGSLPRTEALIELLNKKDAGEEIDPEVFDSAVEKSTRNVIRKQYEVGIDVANDGEQCRIGFDTYVYNRMTGYGGEGVRSEIQDIKEFPTYAESAFPDIGVRVLKTPKAIKSLEYTELSPARNEIKDFTKLLSTEGIEFEEEFMTAASPGAISGILLNDYYDSHEDYVFALAREMKKEYELIAESDLLLQLDCPDLAMERHWMFKDLSTDAFKDVVSLHIDAINKAVEKIPRDQIRLHVCWGNYEGPHHRDVPLKDILPRIYEADVGALLIELANPRHQHEYKVFEEYPLPESMLLVPGVIDVKTNFIEHPEVVADRIENIAEAVGDPTRILAGTDCGFATFAGWRIIDKDIAWAKLEALAEGAELASERLF